MSTPDPVPPGVHRRAAIALAVLLGAAYCVLAWISTKLIPHVGEIGYIWPAGGLALGALLVSQRQTWPALLIAVLVANVVNAVVVGHTLFIGILYALPNVLMPLASALLLQRLLQGPAAFASVRGVLLFLLIAPVNVNAVAAAMGAGVAWLSGAHDYLHEWRIWWVSEALGLMIVTPLVLAWSDVRHTAATTLRGWRGLEAFVAFGGLVLMAQFVFGLHLRADGAVLPVTYLTAPFLIWCSLRFGMGAQAVAVVILAALAIGNTLAGRGPFVVFHDTVESVLQLQLYLAVVATMSLIAAAVAAERARTQHESEDWRRRYEAAIGSSGTLLYDIDLDSGRVVWGGDIGGMLGYTSKDLAELDAWLSVVHEPYRARLPLRKDALAERDRVIEYRVRSKAGGLIDVEDTGEVLRAPDGRPVRAIGLLKDVSERRRFEAERARLDAQLREAQKLEALGTMAGGIAHDFNNILGAILGYTEIAAERAPADPRVQQPLAAVKEASRRGKALVEQLLAFTRRAPPQPVPVRLAPILWEVRRLLEGVIAPNTTIGVEVDDETAETLGDPTQLHQVAYNLAMNAAQAMPDGGRLELVLATEDLPASRVLSNGRIGPGRWVVAKVIDNGTGIAPQVLPRIFEPFYTTKAVGQGTGLGLALVHAIVAAHKGAIDVHTQPGAGTAISVYLTRSQRAAQADAPTLPAVSRGMGQTVLVIDDDTAMRGVAEEMLAELGYEPVGYEDGEAALEAFTANPQRFDALLTDQRMPKLKGDELAQRLRSLRPALPVVIVTGYPEPLLQQPGQDYVVLGKPYAKEALADAMRRALGGAA